MLCDFLAKFSNKELAEHWQIKHVKKVSQIELPWGIKLGKCWLADTDKTIVTAQYYAYVVIPAMEPMPEHEIEQRVRMQTGRADRRLRQCSHC